MITIITDLSGVLVQGGIEGAKIAERRLGIPAAKFLLWYLRLREPYNRLLRGEISEHTYWETFIRKGKFGCAPEQLTACLRESISQVVPGTLGVYKSIIACPDRVGSRHVVSYNETPRFILASDHIQEQVPFLRKTHPEVFELFTDTYWSCCLGVRKQDGPQFLSRIMKDYGLRPDETVFVDDSPKNLRPARGLGIEAVHFRSATDLKTKLHQLGFEFYTP